MDSGSAEIMASIRKSNYPVTEPEKLGIKTILGALPTVMDIYSRRGEFGLKFIRRITKDGRLFELVYARPWHPYYWLRIWYGIRNLFKRK